MTIERTIHFNSETSLKAFIMALPKDISFNVEECRPGHYVMYLN